MDDAPQQRVQALKDLGNRKLEAIDRLLLRRAAERFTEILGENEEPTTIGAGNLEGSLNNTVFVIVTDSAVLLVNNPMREASAFVQRLPYSEIEEIRVEDPGLRARLAQLGERRANLLIRTRGEAIRLKKMQRHRAEEICELVDGRIEW